MEQSTQTKARVKTMSLHYKVVLSDEELPAVSRAIVEVKDIYLDCGEDDKAYAFVGRLTSAEGSIARAKVYNPYTPIKAGF